MREIATTENDDAIACNTGKSSCSDHEAFDMQLIEVGEHALAPGGAQECTPDPGVPKNGVALAFDTGTRR